MRASEDTPIDPAPQLNSIENSQVPDVAVVNQFADQDITILDDASIDAFHLACALIL